MEQQRVDILGVRVSAIDMGMARARIAEWISSRSPHYVCVTGVHGVIECQDDPELLAIHNRAGMVTPDGMPLVFLGRWYGHRQMDRVYGPDLMLEVCRLSEAAGYRHFLYGGGEGVVDRLAARLRQRFPKLRIVGTYSPPFRPLTTGEDREVSALIRDSSPDIVWVGLSTPKQERWMASHVDRLQVPVLVGVGAAFDFHAGLKRQAPRWMQRIALEWLFRLITEPRRLARRYLMNNPRFVWLMIRQLAHGRR